MSEMHGGAEFERRVTVIIPCYNVENYIDRCLDSAVNQGYTDFEIILLDDGSTDCTLKKCLTRKEKDSRITVVAKANEGLGATRNLGIDMAKGEYVTFLDADDWWHEDYLQEMVRGTENGGNDLVVCDFAFVNETENEKSRAVSVLRIPEGRADAVATRHLLSRIRTQACGKLYRRALFTDNGVREPHHAYEDVATTPYIAAKANGIYHVPKAMYFYVRDRAGSIINDFSQIDGLLLSLRELIALFERDGMINEHKHDLKRILWGEQCFLYRMLSAKFAFADEAKKDALRRECAAVVYDIFPDLASVAAKRIYVGNNELFAKAAGNVVLHDSSLLREEDNFDGADIVLLAKDAAMPADKSRCVLQVDVSPEKITDKERFVWDLSDEIFDMMTGV